MNLDLSGLNTPEVLLIAAIGIAVMFFGYRIKKVAFFLIWFILGYHITALALPNVSHLLPDGIELQVYQLLLPIAGGLLLAMLGFSIEKLCVGGICFALVMLITAQYFGVEMQTLAIGGVIGVLAAGLAVIAMKPAIIVATAVAGAYAVTMALLVLVPAINAETWYFPSLIALSVVAALIQFLTTRRVA